MDTMPQATPPVRTRSVLSFASLGVGPADSAGFTLVEIMIVVVIIGLLAAIAIPAFQRVREKSIASRFANDLRLFSDGFQRYNLENGGWPAAQATAGSVSSTLAPYMPEAWSAPSPMGGGYTWSGASGRIRLLGSNATDSVMQRVDELIDDGDLATGDFTKMTGAGNYHLQLH